jgi:hypothetical protein
MLVHCNLLIGMVIGEDVSNNYDVFTFRTIVSEYNRLLQNTQNFLKPYRMGEKYNTMTRICNLMVVHCNQIVRMVIVEDATNHFYDFTLGTVSMEYNRIVSRIYQYSQISTN